MIVQTLNTLAKDVLDMHFNYAREDVQNLYDGKGDSSEDSKYVFMLMPVSNRPVFSGLNRITNNVWGIAVFIGRKSDFDGGNADNNGEDYYNEKWTANIEPLYRDKVVEAMVGAFACLEPFTVTEMNVVEVINWSVASFNLDGLYVTMTINEDVLWAN